MNGPPQLRADDARHAERTARRDRRDGDERDARIHRQPRLIVEEPPPQAIFRQRARGADSQGAAQATAGATIEVAHWAYGAARRRGFRALPADGLRRRRWAGPDLRARSPGLGFEAAIAPALGLTQAKRARPAERAALAADHLLYGCVLSEMRQRPQE